MVVEFVAITGSCGKTTTAHLAGRIAGAMRTGTTSPGNANCGEALAASVRGVAPTDDFHIQELGAWGPGTLDAGLSLVRPSVGVVLNVRRDHLSAFRSLAATQAEKAKVVAALPPEGTAILNADDHLVLEMRAMTGARLLTFGRSAGADLRATDVSARWPERLSFRLAYDGVEHAVTTRLVGEHLLGSALAALGVAVALGVPIDAAARQLAMIEPAERRMSPVVVADGPTFIRDDFKAPSDSLGEVLSFMATARASRKIAVIGRISDYRGRSRPTYTQFARAASDVVDELVFVGERAVSLWARGPRPWDVEGGPERVRLFETVQAASRDLQPRLRPGDLILLKGSGPADHLERILHDHIAAVSCWLRDCGRVIACDECDRLRG